MDIDLIMRALDAAEAFFRARDEMNSEVHLAEVRWSPITNLIGHARNEIYRESQSAGGGDLGTVVDPATFFESLPTEGSDNG